MFIDYYQILEISFTSNDLQIKKAYRLKAIKYHPDKNLGDPYFAKAFLEIKDAYDILIDTVKRAKYDIEYRNQYSNNTYSNNDANNNNSEQTKNNSNEKSKQQEEKFRYDPHKQFYSQYDRELHATPQIKPILDMWGEKLSPDLEYFQLPKNIGKIISGYSDLFLNKNPLSEKQKNLNIIYGLIIGLIIGTLIYFIANLSSPFWICVWYILPIILSIGIMQDNNKFKHTNFYVGINGFAVYTCEEKRDNITYSFEVNFKEITDLFVYQIELSENFTYQHTKYVYVFLDRNKNKIIYERKGQFNKRINERKQSLDINFYRSLEKYWTVYLLDNLEEQLQTNGFILFCLYNPTDNLYQEYIKMGVGQITFIKGVNQEFTYNYNEIKKMYTKKSDLIIQHKNFEKTLFFFKSGNEDVVPLLNLCNRNFFIKALEILLGYTLS